MQFIKKSLFVFFIILTFGLTACTTQQNALSVSFMDVTSPGNTNITFAVKYQEEKDYKNKGTDILIKSDEDNTSFKINKELEQFVEVVLPQKNVYYSLTKLMSGEKFKYTIYENAVNKNYIINSDKDCILTLKAIVGDISEYETMLLNTYDASKEYRLIVKKYKK